VWPWTPVATFGEQARKRQQKGSKLGAKIETFSMIFSVAVESCAFRAKSFGLGRHRKSTVFRCPCTLVFDFLASLGSPWFQHRFSEDFGVPPGDFWDFRQAREKGPVGPDGLARERYYILVHGLWRICRYVDILVVRVKPGKRIKCRC